MGRIECYEYEAVENLAMFTDRTGQVTTFQYAAPNHIIVRICVIVGLWPLIRLQTLRGT